MNSVADQLLALRNLELLERKLAVKNAFREGMLLGVKKSSITLNEFNTQWELSHAKASLDDSTDVTIPMNLN